MPLADPLAAYIVADQILTCACDALSQTPSGCPDRRFVSAGVPPLDDCCQGLLWVQLNRAYNADPFPIESLDVGKCLTSVAAGSFTVGLARCVPVPGARGLRASAPTPAVTEDAISQRTLMDTWALHVGLTCCLYRWSTDVLAPRRAMFSGVESFGPEGGCLTLNATMTVELGPLNC